MTILVTGAGVIGCHTARLLLDRGEKVILFDIAPFIERIATILDPGKVDVVQGDILELEKLERLVAERGVTRIVHTAAILGRRARENPPQTALVNMVGSANILEIARRLGLKRAVLSGSNTVVRPMMEEFRGEAIPEDAALRVVSQHPISFYAATKLGMEFFVHLYARTYGVDAVVIRYGKVLGAWPEGNVGEISSMLQGYLGSAAQGKTVVVDDPTWLWEGLDGFVDARDCAAANADALLAEKLTQRVYYSNGADLYTYEQFLEVLRRIYPDLKIEIRAKAATRGQDAPFDLSAATRDFGYRPRYKLEDTLRYLSVIVRH